MSASAVNSVIRVSPVMAPARTVVALLGQARGAAPVGDLADRAPFDGRAESGADGSCQRIPEKPVGIGIRRQIWHLTSLHRNRLPNTRVLATLLIVRGRDHDATSPGRTAFTRRVWDWFELLPFHRGVLLLGGVVIVPMLVVGGVFALGAGGGTERATADPVPTHQRSARVPDLPERTWGQLIPHRRPRTTTPTGRGARSAAARPHTSTRARPIAPIGGRPPAAKTCPPSLKRWPWMWQLCKRRHGQRPNP